MVGPKYFISTTCVAVLISMGCSKAADSTATLSDSTSNLSQTAIAEANSQASASESSSTVGFMSEENAAGDIHTFSTCTFSSAIGSCSSSADALTWGGCTIDGGAATMTGGWNETFSGTGAGTCTVPIVNGETVTRTTTSSVLSGGGAYGGSIITDTNGGTTYDGTVLPSTGTTVVSSGATRTITINGTHKLGKTAGGVTVFEHYLRTPTPLTVTGTRAGGNRAITGGTITVYHNLAKYQASLTFSGVTWGSSSCCYPTSGTLTGTLSGSLTGTTTMTFSSTCGTAAYVDNSGANGTVTLSQCN